MQSIRLLLLLKLADKSEYHKQRAPKAEMERRVHETAQKLKTVHY